MRSPVVAYGGTVGALVAAVLLRWLLDPLMGDALPLVTLFGAVAAAVWLGGYRPALIVVVLGYLACACLFINPRGSFGFTEARNLVGLVAYLVTCAIIIGFGEAMRVSQRRFDELVRQQEQVSPPTSAIIESLRRKHSLRDVVVIGFGLTFAVLVVGGVLGYVNAERLVKNEGMVAHTSIVIGELDNLVSTLKDAETGQRGYLLAEKDEYLEPYNDALGRVQSSLSRLRELTIDNHDHQARLDALEQKVALRLDELKRTVALMKAGDRDAALKIVRSDEGKMLMDDVRKAAAVMRGEEDRLLEQQAEESKASSSITKLSILLPAVIGLVLVGSVFYLSQRNLSQRQRAAEVLAEQRERLRTTLASIGDAVISTDTEGRIISMNAVAEALTGWKLEEASGQQLDTVFRIVNEQTRQPVHNPATKAMNEGIIVGLANHTVLIAKDGTELPIDDSAAPIRCAKGEVVGCVLVFRDVTERRKAHRTARFLASIIESSDDAIIGKDVNGIITSWNRAAEQLFGYSAAEALGRPIAILAPSDRVDEMPAILARLKQGERVEHFDTVRRAKDGRLVPISLTVSPIKNEDGEIVGASKIARDISERKRAEEALHEEKERLHATLTGIGDAVIVTDAEGRVTLMNSVAQTLTGWKEEAAGRPLEEVFRIINEQTRQPAESPVRKVMREGAVVGLANHTALVAKDGTESPIEDSAAPIRGKTGEVMGVVLVFRDATQRRQAEEAVRESQRREKERADELEAILRTTPTPIWIAHDPHCHRITGNPASLTLLRLPEGSNVSAATSPGHDPIKRGFREYRGDRPIPLDELPMQKATRGESVNGAEVKFVFDDGSVRYIYGNAVPLLNPDGSVRGCVAAFTDITRLKESEEALRQADRRKDEFLATLAHELRNPLAPIRNSIELLRRGDGNTELIEQASRMMERQVRQIVRLVDDLLDISRITQRKIQLRKERVELGAVVQSAVEECRPLIEAQSDELNVTLPPDPIYLEADPTRLSQVFANLLSNAAKYTEKGGRIWLTAERLGGEIIVSVRDTGIGIAAEHLPHIFEMFSQVAPALERSQGGLGIGLALVRGLVELHGGTIEAGSAGPGRGSEFTVRLPIIETPVQARQEPSGDGEKSGYGKKCRILIADDLRDSADSLAMMLRLAGHDIQTAHDGLEAVQAAATFRPDVALLDIGMPKMNGYQAARHIREQAWGKKMVLVALTGWGHEEDKRRAAEAGFDHHLTKPVEPAALEELLATVVV
jgi:PAS domain S-box-containing protein